MPMLRGKQKAGLPDETSAKDLPALAQLRHTTEVLRHAETGDQGASAVAYSQPHLQVSAPKGILATTPADAVLVATTQLTAVAKQDANVAAGGNLAMASTEGISLFAHGKTVGPTSDATPGIALHAATGKVGLTASTGGAAFAAEKQVTFASTQASATVEAKQHVLLNAAGAQIKVTNGTIELHAPGMVTFKGANHNLVGPGGAQVNNTLPKGKPPYDEQFVLRNKETQEILPHHPYVVEDAKGNVLAQGMTDEQGRISRVYTASQEGIKVLF